MKKLVVLIFAALALSSCCNCGRNSVEQRAFKGTTWELIQLGGTEVNIDGKYQVMFSEDGRMSGIGFCNRLMGGYKDDAEQKQIEIAPIASTEMMCMGENVETEFFKSFDGVTSYAIDGDKLYLFANGELRAVFEAKS